MSIPRSAILLLAATLCGPALAEPLAGTAYTHAAAAYAALDAKDLDAAEREARAAQTLAPDHPDAVRLLVDVLNRRGNRAGALAVADRAIAAGVSDPALLAQRGYLHAAEGEPAAALADFRAALTHPTLAVEQRRTLSLAAADQAASLARPQDALDLLAPYAADPAYAVSARRGFALFSLERSAEARNAFADAVRTAGTAEERHTARKGLAQSAAALGETDTVRVLVQEIAAAGTACDLDLVYLLLRIGDDSAALAMADTIPCAAALTPAVQVDLGYAAKRLSRNREAAARFERGLDAYKDTGTPIDPAAFGLRREIETLQREMGLTASLTSLQSRSDAGGGNSTQFIAEAYWQPEAFGFRNGKVAQLYARLSDSGPGIGAGTADSQALEAAFGARYKPLAETNIVVAAERHVALERNAIDDWLLRAGYSGGFGLDLDPTAPHWLFEQHYAEVGYYIDQDRTLMSGDVRSGLTARLPGPANLTGALYLGGTVSYDSAEIREASAGIGPGLSLRYWFRETEHQAPASSVTLDMGYRLALTPSDRVGGFYLQLYLAY